MEESNDGEDLMDNMEEDYRPIPILDQFEDIDLDDQEHSEIGEEDRRRAELAMYERDMRDQAVN